MWFLRLPLYTLYFILYTLQDDRGRRLMWFLRLHATAALITAAIAVMALGWFIAGLSPVCSLSDIVCVMLAVGVIASVPQLGSSWLCNWTN